MPRGPLQEKLFENNMTATVEMTELYGDKPGGVFEFVDLDKGYKDTLIKTCWGDLIVMINALEDYANILEAVIPEWKLKGQHKFLYELHAERCRKIARGYAQKIDYDYQKALKKCAKKRERKTDTGLDALEAAVNQNKQKAKEEKQELLFKAEEAK